MPCESARPLPFLYLISKHRTLTVHCNRHDPDEIEEEQREVDRRNKINNEFQTFVKRVQENWERDYSSLDLEFDIPFRLSLNLGAGAVRQGMNRTEGRRGNGKMLWTTECKFHRRRHLRLWILVLRDLGFHGVANRSTSYIIPTTNCLVELVEPPFLVITLDEIEVVNFERVGFNLKNFDMAIIFKDFTKDVLRIDAIPSAKCALITCPRLSLCCTAPAASFHRSNPTSCLPASNITTRLHAMRDTTSLPLPPSTHIDLPEADVSRNQFPLGVSSRLPLPSAVFDDLLVSFPASTPCGSG